VNSGVSEIFTSVFHVEQAMISKDCQF